MSEILSESGSTLRNNERQSILTCLTDTAIDGKEILDRFKRDGKEIVWDARKSYGMSDADGSLKWSGDFSECLGVVIAGTDTDNKPISILLHVLPNLPLTDRRFLPEFKQKIDHFMQSTVRGSVEVVMFGGRVHQHDHTANPNGTYDRDVRAIYLLF